MMNFTGIDAWNTEYQIKALPELNAANMDAEQLLQTLSNFKTQLTKRINGCSETAHNEEKLIYMTADSVGMFPTEVFLLYICSMLTPSAITSPPLRLSWRNGSVKIHHS